MIDHLAVDVSDLEKSGHFYDNALEPLGYKKLMEAPQEFGDVWFSVGGIQLKLSFILVKVHAMSRDFILHSEQTIAKRSTNSTKRLLLLGAKTMANLV